MLEHGIAIPFCQFDKLAPWQNATFNREVVSPSLRDDQATLSFTGKHNRFTVF